MKKIFTIILAITMCMAMTFTSYASDEKYVFDEAEYITTESEYSLSEKAAGIYNDTGIVVSYIVIKSVDGNLGDYAEKVYKEKFGNKAGIMLAETDEKWAIHKEGEAEDIFSSKDENAMWDACGNASYYNEGVEAYFEVASGILKDQGITVKEESEPTTEAATEVEADPNHPSRLVDDADLLYEDEEKELKANLDEISTRQDVDVVIVTVETLGGKTVEAFADDYFDYNGYGLGYNRDGIIFVISMGERKMAMSTCGYAITAFTDEGQNYMWDNITPFISNESYNMAFNEFAELCDEFIAQAKTGEPYDVGNMPSPISLLGIIAWLIPSFLIAAIISLFLKKKKRESLKSVMMRNDASDYWDEFDMTEEYDQYLRTDVVTIKVKSDDGGGGSGGSTTHVGSSGTIHGGSSRSF